MTSVEFDFTFSCFSSTLGIMKEIKRRKVKYSSLMTSVTDDILSANGDECAKEHPVSSVGLTSSLLPNRNVQDDDDVFGNNKHQKGVKLSRSQRSSLEASIGLDVAQETFGEGSWMLHSYSSMSEYHASR